MLRCEELLWRFKEEGYARQDTSGRGGEFCICGDGDGPGSTSKQVRRSERNSESDYGDLASSRFKEQSLNCAVESLARRTSFVR
jgi:hypothetical protein